tara:strand:- start:112 stop:2973 length:2862 start_codon:yes stop_codon:yes gene_type:complete
MSIHISKKPNSYTRDNFHNKIVINSYESDNKNLIELNTGIDVLNDETYIQIGRDIKLGSSNNMFVIQDNLEQNLLNLNSSFLTFSQEVFFENEVNFLDNIFISQNNTTITKDLIINNSNFDVNNVLHVDQNNVIIHNLITSNLQTNHIIKTNRIQPINSNIIIEGLLFEDYRALNSTFKNNINIDFNLFPNNISENNDCLLINKIENSCNFVLLKENNIDKFNINHNGFINIGNQTNDDTIALNIKSDQENIIKINDTFNINNKGAVSIGDIRDNKTLLNIHRNDIHTQNEILNEPLSIYSMDYNPINNYITSNIVSLPFISSNIVLNTNQSFDDISYLLHLDLVFNHFDSLHQVKWISNDYTYINGLDDINSNLQLKIGINNINYGDYQFKFLDLRTSDNTLIQNVGFSSNIKLVTGFWLNDETKLNELMNELITNTAINDSNYDFIQFNHSENIHLENNVDFDNYTLNINVNIIIEKSIETKYLQYFNTIPQLQLPPHFINFSSNNQIIGSIDGYGLLDIKDIHINNTGTIKNAYIDNIIQDIDFNYNDINNTNRVNADTVYVGDRIVIGDITISKEGGIIFNESSNIAIESKINSVNISNINSPYFKYNNSSTSILNNLNIGSDLSLLNSIRDNHNSYDIIISGSGIYIEGDKANINIQGSDSYMKIGSNIIGYDTRQDDSGNKLYSYLNSKNNNTTYWRNYNEIDLLSFGNDDFFCVSTNHTNNKISIGIPTNFLQETEDKNYWFQYFNDITYQENKSNYSKYNNLKNLHSVESSFLNHIVTIYGNTRIADINNYTILEVRDEIGSSNLTVYGNIKCSKKIQEITTTGVNYYENSDALYADGNISVDGRLYTTGGVASLSDRRVKQEIELIREPIEKIKQISGYTYFRSDLKKMDTGLIAQEVEQILPEVIEIGNNDYKTISYGNMTGLIVEAIKNIDKRLEVLENLCS